MSRSGAFYFIEAMNGAARGEPGVSGRRAADHRAPTAGRPDGSTFSLMRRMLAVVRRTIGAHGRASRGRHRLGDAARAD
jgi:hypothetical protein